jgi:diguanylate cyclase (GGDEF)-like protein
VSPDAIVDAIVEEVGSGTGADHIVVARRRPDARVLEATLVNTGTGGPSSSTLFPISDLEDATPRDARRPGRPGDPPENRVADRIARRSRDVYGLKHTLSAPLTTDSGVVGAIVVSRRTAEGWPASAERILNAAAVEASAALSRAYSHREAEARASTDALTGLPNRRYFDEFCALLARRRRSEDAIGILMVDIDKFKLLNDAHGHAVGDEVLRAVAGAIAGAVREDDVPARFGGEEFAVLLRNPHIDEAVEVGERIREAVSTLDLSRFGVAAASVSVGVAVATVPDQPIADIIEQADRALYDAKRRGRDRVVAA